MAKLDDLPCEILQLIFSFQCQPYDLFQHILTFSHINKTFRSITNDKDNFWQPLIRQYRKVQHNNDNEDDEDNNGHYFPTHSFIDELLFITHRQKFTDFTKDDKQFTLHYQKHDDDDESDQVLLLGDKEKEEKQQKNLFERFSDWISDYSNMKEENLILKTLIQICLGREMIEHLGSNHVNILIEMFFEKLLEPAIELVNSWKEKPNEIEWKDQIIFNINLLNLLEHSGNIFSENITNYWNELDSFTSCIPRKYLLYLVEKFNGIIAIIKLEDDNSGSTGSSNTCMVTQIMKRLRDFGIKVERMSFNNVGIKLNYKRNELLESLIPEMATSFYLQHLAVWINSSTLLEWCLTVGSKYASTNLAHLSNNSSLNIPLEAHVNTYIHDACGLTSLHYAIQRGNVEISQLLIEKYFANPFVESKILYNDMKLTPCMLSQIEIEEEGNQKFQIYQILYEKYGNDVKVLFESNEQQHIKQVDRPNDMYKLSLEKIQDEIPLREFFTVETERERNDEFDDNVSDHFENEYGLSYSWIESQIKDETSLKRKRNPNMDYIYNENLRKIRKPLSELESVKWRMDRIEPVWLNSFDHLENTMHVKILKRYPNSKEKTVNEENEEDSDNETETNDEIVSEEFISRKDLTFPKIPIDLLLQETLMDFKNDANILPNGKMLIQQAIEHLISNNFTLAQSIAEFSGRDFIKEGDVTLASKMISSKTELNKYWYPTLSESRKTYTLQRYRDELVENLNIQPECIRKQLSKFIPDETILQTLISLIEDQFESTYLNDETNDETDTDYEGESVHSSDSTHYSTDSMLSNICFTEEQDEFKTLCYSVKSAKSFRISATDFTIYERQDEKVKENDFLETKIYFTTDRNKAIMWLNEN